MRIANGRCFLNIRPKILLLSFTIACLHLSAQSKSVDGSQTQSSAVSPTAQLPLRFEVISVRAHKSAGNESSDRRVTQEDALLPGTTARTLMRYAGTDDNRMSGARKLGR